MHDQLLTLEEVAALLRVSKDAIARFMRAPDPIPVMKAGRRYLYDREAVLRWASRAAKRALAGEGG